MSALLPLRPTLHSDENVLGYIIRLAKTNHFDCISRMFTSYLLPSASVAYSKSTLEKNTLLAEKLIGRSLPSDSVFVAGAFSGELAVQDSKRFSISRKPCICTECVRDEGFLKSEWQYTLNSFCEKHSCELINVCPKCNTELKWDVCLLNLQCHHCHSDLRSRVLTETPAHIRMLSVVKNKEHCAMTEQLFDTAHKLMRPFDLMEKRITQSPKMLRNWNELFDSAARIIADKAVIPSAYEFLTGNADKSLFKEYVVSPLSQGMRSALKRSPTDEDCRNFMNNKGLYKWFGLLPYHMDCCVRMSYVKVVFKKEYCGSLIYDFRDWQRILSKFRPLDNVGAHIKSVEVEAPVFWCHEEEVVVGILRGKIPVRFANPTMPNFSEAWVDRKATHKYLRKQQTLLKEPLVTSRQAMLVLGNQKGALKEMIRNNDLRTHRSSPRESFVCIDSLQQQVNSGNFPNRDKILDAYSGLL